MIIKFYYLSQTHRTYIEELLLVNNSLQIVGLQVDNPGYCTDFGFNPGSRIFFCLIQTDDNTVSILDTSLQDTEVRPPEEGFPPFKIFVLPMLSETISQIIVYRIARITVWHLLVENGRVIKNKQVTLKIGVGVLVGFQYERTRD